MNITEPRQMISLNQREVLRNIFTDKVYSEHTDSLDMSNLEEVMARLTEKQYKYILYLLGFKRWVSVKQVLNSRGLINK
jgi:hypothetical protein